MCKLSSRKERYVRMIFERSSFLSFLVGELGFKCNFFKILNSTTEKTDFFLFSQKFLDNLKHLISPRADEPTSIEENKLHLLRIRINSIIKIFRSFLKDSSQKKLSIYKIFGTSKIDKRKKHLHTMIIKYALVYRSTLKIQVRKIIQIFLFFKKSRRMCEIQ